MYDVPIFCINNLIFYTPSYNKKKLRIFLDSNLKDDFIFESSIGRKRKDKNSMIDTPVFSDKKLPTINSKKILVKKMDNKYIANLDGVFGNSFFINKIFKIDYSICKLTLLNKVVGKYNKIKIKGNKLKYITVKIENKNYNFLIGIGATFINKVSKQFSSINYMDKKYINLFKCKKTPYDDIDLSSIYILNQLKFGKNTEKSIDFLEKSWNPYSKYWSKEETIKDLVGVLGGNFLSRFESIILDFKNNILYYI